MFQYFATQFFRLDHFHFRPMLEYIHHQFARIGIGNAQFIAAISKQQTLLLRMPVFIRHCVSYHEQSPVRHE